MLAMEIDWKQAPKLAQWWAVDANGQANWFGEPNVAPHTDFWLNLPQRAPLFGFKGNWRKSLVKRPRTSRGKVASEAGILPDPNFKSGGK